MNIGLDSFPLWNSMGRGIGNYAISLYKKVISQTCNQSNKIFILNWRSESLKNYLIETQNYTEYQVHAEKNFPLEVSYVKEQIQKFVKMYEIDVFYTPNALEQQMPCYEKEWFGGTKLIGTVHDIIPWKMKKWYFATGGGEKYKSYCENLAEYDLLFSQSNTTKKDLEDEFGIVNVVNISMSSEIPQIDQVQLDKKFDEIRKKFNIEESYNIFVGGLGINKNLPNIVRAYLQTYQSNRAINALVIVCKLNEGVKKDIYSFIKRYNLQEKLIFTDYVEEIEMAALHLYADWCVFPTLYEGFGMPVIEAWKYGLPVLTSDNSSLYEITQDAAVHVNPNSVESIRNGFELIDKMDNVERERYRKLGQERVKHFSWDKTAKMFMDEILGL